MHNQLKVTTDIWFPSVAIISHTAIHPRVLILSGVKGQVTGSTIDCPQNIPTICEVVHLSLAGISEGNSYVGGVVQD